MERWKYAIITSQNPRSRPSPENAQSPATFDHSHHLARLRMTSTAATFVPRSASLLRGSGSAAPARTTAASRISLRGAHPQPPPAAAGAERALNHRPRRTNLCGSEYRGDLPHAPASVLRPSTSAEHARVSPATRALNHHQRPSPAARGRTNFCGRGRGASEMCGRRRGEGDWGRERRLSPDGFENCATAARRGCSGGPSPG